MTGVSRRTFITGSAAAAVLAGVGFNNTAEAAAIGNDGQTYRLTVLGTTDLHGNVFNWDYFKNAEYDDKAGNDIGIAKAATLIKAVRAERGRRHTLTLDAGDTIQGTPLAYYYAKIDPITGRVDAPDGRRDERVGYDAAALGNHEFNYGIDALRAFERQLRLPAAAAQRLDAKTGAPAFTPYVIKPVKVDRTGSRSRSASSGWSRPASRSGTRPTSRARWSSPASSSRPRSTCRSCKAAGADVVIVSCHSGADTSSSYGDALP